MTKYEIDDATAGRMMADIALMTMLDPDESYPYALVVIGPSGEGRCPVRVLSNISGPVENIAETLAVGGLHVISDSSDRCRKYLA